MAAKTTKPDKEADEAKAPASAMPGQTPQEPSKEQQAINALTQQVRSLQSDLNISNRINGELRLENEKAVTAGQKLAQEQQLYKGAFFALCEAAGMDSNEPIQFESAMELLMSRVTPEEVAAA